MLLIIDAGGGRGGCVHVEERWGLAGVASGDRVCRIHGMLHRRRTKLPPVGCLVSMRTA